MKLQSIVVYVPMALALAGISGCFTDGGPGSIEHARETQTESLSVPVGKAKAVSVHLKLAAGELNISGGSSKLLDGTIQYNVPDWKPDVSYNVSGNQGTLMVMQPESSHTTMGDVKYIWDLHFSNSVPEEIAVEMGAGKSDMNFSGMKLKNLDVQVGAGDSTIDLTGNWKENLTASIQGGVGQAHIKLPRDTGVRVTVEGGIGTVSAPDFKRDGDAYINDAYGKSKATLQIHVEGGVGQVHLELVGGRAVV